MRRAFAGAGDTAAVQHARFPLAYPEEAKKILVLSQSLPTLHDLRSKILAPGANISAGSVSPMLRGGDSLTCTQRDRTVRGIRDRLDSSKLSDALKKDLKLKLEVVTEKIETAKSMQESERRALGRCQGNAHDNPDELPLVGEGYLNEGQLSHADDYEDKPSMSDKIKHRSSDPSISLSLSQAQKDHRLVVQPLVLPSSLGLSAVDPMQQQDSVDNHQALLPRSSDWRGHTVTGGWRSTRSNTVTPMRATWSGAFGPGSRGKSKTLNKMVDWNVAWLEHPEGGLEPRNRSRSPSPSDDKPVRSISADLRNYNVLLPPMHEHSPMLLTDAEHKKADVNKLTPLPGSPDLRVSSSEWRLRTLSVKSLAHSVRGRG